MFFSLENLFISKAFVLVKKQNVCLSLTGVAGGGGGAGSKNMQSIFKTTVLCYFLSGRLKWF